MSPATPAWQLNQATSPDGDSVIAVSRWSGPTAHDPGDSARGAEAVVDSHDGHPARAGCVHGEQRGHAFERGAVSDAGRNGHHRCAGQSADHAGERALHAGDDDQRIGIGDHVELGEEPVQAGDTDVGDQGCLDPGGAQCGQRLVGNGSITGAGGDHHDTTVEQIGRCTPEQAATEFDDITVDGTAGAALVRRRSGEQDRSGAVLQQLRHDARAVVRLFARPVDRFGDTLAQMPVMVDRGTLHIGEGQPAETLDGVVGADRAGLHVVDELSQGRLVHRFIVPCDRVADVA